MIPDNITPVILCGGIGSRLWPRSRSAAPKPFLPLVGTGTLFQDVLTRCRDAGFGKPLIVTGEDHVDLVKHQVENFEIAEMIVEPCSRQTAAAVAVAALRLKSDAIMLVCPSDHHIERGSGFAKACCEAAELARKGLLACITVEATSPETRFGYVRAGEPCGGDSFRVAEFAEKPDRTTAQRYLDSRLYAWNTGIFAFRAADYLGELDRHRPEIAASAREAVDRGEERGSQFFPDAGAYKDIQPQSLDCAVMENTSCAAMVVADIHWSDLGDWRSLKRMREKDCDGNSIRGAAEVVQCHNILIDTDGPKVHALGLQDLIVVVDGNDILISSAEAANEIRHFSRRRQA